MQPKRILVLMAIVLLVGVVTRAFAQAPVAGFADAGSAAITRAHAVALLVEADPVLRLRLGAYVRRMPPLSLFDDVDPREWHAPYIETAFEAGIVTGNAERLFRPDDALTDEEMIALAARFRAMSHPEITVEIAQHPGNWFNGAVMASIHNGLDLPFPIRLGQPARSGDFIALLQSMDITNPSQLALSHRPVNVVVARQPVAPSPRSAVPASSSASSTSSAPAAVVPAPPQNAGPQPSQKSFAISMPSLGIEDLTITHPADPFTKDGLLAPLTYGVGHLFSYPGKGGKILVYGHSSSYPWDVSDYTKIFRQINKLNVGDLIYVTYGGTLHTYKVSRKQTVPADDTSAYSGAGEELILYTCWPPDSIKERYLVHAVPA